VTEAFNVKFS